MASAQTWSSLQRIGWAIGLVTYRPRCTIETRTSDISDIGVGTARRDSAASGSNSLLSGRMPIKVIGYAVRPDASGLCDPSRVASVRALLVDGTLLVRSAAARPTRPAIV